MFCLAGTGTGERWYRGYGPSKHDGLSKPTAFDRHSMDGESEVRQLASLLRQEQLEAC